MKDEFSEQLVLEVLGETWNSVFTFGDHMFRETIAEKMMRKENSEEPSC